MGWCKPSEPDCSADSAEVKVDSKTCTMPSMGQIVITNPTLLGLGGDEVVTVKIRQR